MCVCVFSIHSERHCALTLPDSTSVNVNLHRKGGVKRLVIVKDKDITPQGMDSSRVHCCILGNGVTEEESKYECWL